MAWIGGGSLYLGCLAVIWRVEEDYLRAALQAIDRVHGGMDGYLRHRIGLGAAEFEALADRFLEP